MWNQQKIEEEEQSTQYSSKSIYQNNQTHNYSAHHDYNSTHPKLITPSGHCSYRSADESKVMPVIIVHNNWQLSNHNFKGCSFREINPSPLLQSTQFSSYYTQFYSDNFLNTWNFANSEQYAHRGIAEFTGSEKQKTAHQILLGISSQQSQQDLLKKITLYLHDIKPNFNNALDNSSQSEKIQLRFKGNCKEYVSEQILIIFKQFLNRARETKISKNTKPHTPASDGKNSFRKQQQLKNNKKVTKPPKHEVSSQDEALSFIRGSVSSETEERDNTNFDSLEFKKKSVQSQYHNLKNSFMQLLIQLFSTEILSCFDFSQYLLQNVVDIVNRMKENSVKYRPVKGKYQYYSNAHYLSLFLQFTDRNLENVKKDSQMQSLHEILYRENIENCSSVNDTAIVKCNYYKWIFGQIASRCLELAEELLLSDSLIDNMQKYSSSSFNTNSRYCYISKVKKGITKLQSGREIIRF